MKTSYTRRSAIVTGILGGAGMIALPRLGSAIGPTPPETEGPFYPETSIEKQLFNDTDLIRKMGDHEAAKGQPTRVFGKVQDQSGRPIKGAIVEVWQACASGRYNHARDNNNPSLLDNNFQFWGRSITAGDGKYSFKTIIPGKYPGRNGRQPVRGAHAQRGGRRADGVRQLRGVLGRRVDRGRLREVQKRAIRGKGRLGHPAVVPQLPR